MTNRTISMKALSLLSIPSLKLFHIRARFKDHLLSSVIHSMAKLTIWIFKVYREWRKAWLKYAVSEVFQNHGHQSCWAETLHQG